LRSSGRPFPLSWWGRLGPWRPSCRACWLRLSQRKRGPRGWPLRYTRRRSSWSCCTRRYRPLHRFLRRFY